MLLPRSARLDAGVGGSALVRRHGLDASISLAAGRPGAVPRRIRLRPAMRVAAHAPAAAVLGRHAFPRAVTRFSASDLSRVPGIYSRHAGRFLAANCMLTECYLNSGAEWPMTPAR